MKKNTEYKIKLRRAKSIILFTKNSSPSALQRKMCISYSYALLLMGDIAKLNGFCFLRKKLKKLI